MSTGEWWLSAWMGVVIVVCTWCAAWCRRMELRAVAAANRAALRAEQAERNARGAALAASEATRAALASGRRVWDGTGWVSAGEWSPVEQLGARVGERRITDDEVRRRTSGEDL